MLHDGDAPIVQLISSTFVRGRRSDKLGDSQDSRASVKRGQEAPGGYKLPGAFFLMGHGPAALAFSATSIMRETLACFLKHCRCNFGEENF